MQPRHLATLIGLALATTTASAHHSFAMFDPTKPMTFDGTVKTLQWTAPHAIVWIEADKVGQYNAGLWSLELPTSPGNLSKMGWSRTSLVPGDKIRVDIDPIRDGRRGGRFKRATILATGKVLSVGAVPGAGAGPAGK